MRSTSVEAYNAIEESGILSRRRWQVYDVLYHHGPLTQLQLSQKYFPKEQPRCVQPCVSHLVKMGVVKYAGEIIDGQTKMRSILWDVTNELPIKLPKHESKDKQIIHLKEKIFYLRWKIKKYKRKLRAHNK